jgi:flavin reductase (DIM6/NTAB) family NADH-FMN oxidoreductase RutF
MTFTERMLRNTLGMFPTGVAVVTARGDEGTLQGVTVNSFNSVSLNPPLVLFSLSRKLFSLNIFLAADAFAINFCRRFSRTFRFGLTRPCRINGSRLRTNLESREHPLFCRR